MIIFKTVSDIRKHLSDLKKESKTIGFVPTMGALHQGHLSLIKLAQGNCDTVVCSIFVNPTQFNNSDDFAKYPITIENDIYLLEKQGCDILFLPSTEEIYPDGKDLKEPYNLGAVETVLEGIFRPGHFQGVCQVVDRLLTIVQPNIICMGQKDYQQIMVIKKMIELKNHPVKMIIGETLRETSGLAASSRNLRLSEEEKEKAVAIYNTLIYLKENIAAETFNSLIPKASEMLMNKGFHQIDYISICNADSLMPLQQYNASVRIVALIAAYMGDVRLIDNMFLN